MVSEKDEMFIHVTAKAVICQYGLPLAGWYRGDFRFTRYSHPHVHFMISKDLNATTDRLKINNAVMNALQSGGHSVGALQYDYPPRKEKKTDEISPLQKRLFD